MQISWKTSTMGGNTWALPRTLTTDRREWMTGRRGQPTSSTPDMPAAICVQLFPYMGARMEQTGKHILDKLQQIDPWAHAGQAAETLLHQEHQLTPEIQRDGTWKGAFYYTASNEQEAQELFQTLNNIGVFSWPKTSPGTAARRALYKGRPS